MASARRRRGSEVRWRWPPWRPAEVTVDEARAELQKLKERDREVARLGEELRERQRLNHFSGMVAQAIRRGAQGGP
jgi:ribosomal protein S4